MSLAGRTLRAKMLDDARETPERARERVAAREAGEAAQLALKLRFPAITVENFAEVEAYRKLVERAEYERRMGAESAMIRFGRLR